MASIKRVLGDVIGKVLFKELTIERVHDVAPRFRRIDLTSESLRGTGFTPGDKLQVMLDDGPRTYTPFSFDGARGALSLLVHVHGDTSGARWGRSAAPGDRLRAFGPRGAIPLPSFEGPLVLFGDETSFATGRVLHELRGASLRAAFVFEVASREESRTALAYLGLPEEGLVERRPDDAHLAEVAERVSSALAAHPGSQLVLTGKGPSIQALRAALKARSVNAAGQKVKAYWAPGKRGLD
ncbi:siderophore-interacting protein [Myxococcaceae bacterium GXIMD 01537]